MPASAPATSGPGKPAPLKERFKAWRKEKRETWDLYSISSYDRREILIRHFIDNEYEDRENNRKGWDYLPEADLDTRQKWLRKLIEKDEAEKSEKQVLNPIKRDLIRAMLLEEDTSQWDNSRVTALSAYATEENLEASLRRLLARRLTQLRSTPEKVARWGTIIFTAAGIAVPGGLYLSKLIYIPIITAIGLSTAAFPLAAFWPVVALLGFAIVAVGLYLSPVPEYMAKRQVKTDTKEANDSIAEDQKLIELKELSEMQVKALAKLQRLEDCLMGPAVEVSSAPRERISGFLRSVANRTSAPVGATKKRTTLTLDDPDDAASTVPCTDAVDAADTSTDGLLQQIAEMRANVYKWGKDSEFTLSRLDERLGSGLQLIDGLPTAGEIAKTLAPQFGELQTALSGQAGNAAAIQERLAATEESAKTAAAAAEKATDAITALREQLAAQTAPVAQIDTQGFESSIAQALRPMQESIAGLAKEFAVVKAELKGAPGPDQSEKLGAIECQLAALTEKLEAQSKASKAEDASTDSRPASPLSGSGAVSMFGSAGGDPLHNVIQAAVRVNMRSIGESITELKAAVEELRARFPEPIPKGQFPAPFASTS
jgi:hypothetical protein